MNKLQSTGILLGAVALAAGLLEAGAPVAAQQGLRAAATATSYSFTPISNPNDLTFTQLLGINQGGVIAGYFGSGADAQHPNKGFVLHLPSTFTPENFPNSVQTQVIGINNAGDTDGFYIDANGVTHGFTNIGGSFTTVDVVSTAFNQLLGLNNRGQQAGYFGFGPNNGTFAPFIRQPDGSILLLPIANAQATGINDQGLVSGFYNDANGNSHGFLWQSGMPQVVNFPGAVSTQLLGLNNQGQAVGTYTDIQKGTHGFVYNLITKTFTQIDAPGATATVVNGINSLGTLVGFFTDANNNTIGFVATPGGVVPPTPTPTSTPVAGKIATTTSLSAQPSATFLFVPVTFTITVSPMQAAGAVEVFDGSLPIAIGQLHNGVFTFSRSFGAVGAHNITAQYFGNTTYQGSTSPVVVVQIFRHIG